jgi:primosomal protein N' (replication factor Y)
VERDEPPELNDDQKAAASAILEALSDRSAGARGFLLFGVTGSGKTEVYMHAIARALELGRGALVLVPEIALTPQLLGRFRARFGDAVAVVHSALSAADRHQMWKRLRAGELRVAVGARSALFAPVPDLGLVVVDEEHDSSYKQEDGVRYHARDMAQLRAHRAGAITVLGSATPSLESMVLVRRGKLSQLELPDRATDAPLPAVEIIDLKRFGAGPTGDRLLTLPLHRAIEKALQAKEQIIIFLNRRGFSPAIVCGGCGVAQTCRLCSVSLTYHRREGGRMRCHYCDFNAPLAERCSECRSGQLMLEGLGTEKLERTLAEAFPTAEVARLDRDVAGGAKSQRVLDRVRNREVDILVGTQMVTKGHDLPGVTLVGVVNADAALSMPDFRAAERGFQLLVQVAGRAGRREQRGRVLIQTRDPNHPAVVFACRHDVRGFLERELSDREEVRYPPFLRLALLRIDAVDESVARQAAAHLAALARAAPQAKQVEVLGPAPAPIARLRNRYRFRVMLRAEGRGPLRQMLARLAVELPKLERRVRAVIDVDPVSML